MTDPWPYMQRLEDFVGAKITRGSGRALKRQKCPREQLMAGRGHKSYGWKRQDKNTNDVDDYRRRKNFVESRASTEVIDLLKELSNDYGKKYQE